MNQQAVTVETARRLAVDTIRLTTSASQQFRNRREVSLRHLADLVGKRLNVNREGFDFPEVRTGCDLALWDAARAGLLNPVAVELGRPMGSLEHRFYFTDLGEQWLDGTANPNPFADEYVTELTERAALFDGEPAVIFVEARRAKNAGLLRAAMILLGLSGECMVRRMFDDGTANGVVQNKEAKKRGNAEGVQRDVADAMRGLEGNQLVRKGETDRWVVAANTYRDRRNECAHDPRYLPDPSQAEAGFFAWTDFVLRSDMVWKLIK